MANTHRKMDTKELRMFGITFALVLASLFGVLLPLVRYGSVFESWPLWPWISSAAIAACALIHPAALKFLHTPWMKFASVAQWVNTRIIMFLMFFLLIFPIGLVLRLLGKDAMNRKFDRELQSYRVKAERQDKNHMEKPY